MFGPTLGAMCVSSFWKEKYGLGEFEKGTLPFETISGVIGMGGFFGEMGTLFCSGGGDDDDSDRALTPNIIQSAYDNIRIAETNTLGYLVRMVDVWVERGGVRVLEKVGGERDFENRLPLVTFIHTSLTSETIVNALEKGENGGVIIRRGTFLSQECVANTLKEMGEDEGKEPFRVSISVYNTVGDVKRFVEGCEGIEGWWGGA